MDQMLLRDALTSAYAAGSLDPALQLMLETQASIRAAARAELDAGDAISGAMLERETPALLRADALASVFAAIDGERGRDVAQRQAAQAASSLIDEVLRLPKPVQDAALEAIGQGGWQFAGPGLRTLRLPVDSACKTEIIRIEPGWGSPRHSHGGAEYTLVMKGAFSDARGRYGAGDIAIAGPDLAHSPVAERGEVCYALAVSEAPAQLTGALGLLQRIWRH